MRIRDLVEDYTKQEPIPELQPICEALKRYGCTYECTQGVTEGTRQNLDVDHPGAERHPFARISIAAGGNVTISVIGSNEQRHTYPGKNGVHMAMLALETFLAPDGEWYKTNLIKKESMK